MSTPLLQASADSTPPSASSSSQARESSKGKTNNKDKVEHDEFLIEALTNLAKGKRKFIQPKTSKPQLRHHGIHVYPALCSFKAVDDAVRMVATGIIWDVEDVEWEVLLVASLGWAVHGSNGNQRSHQVEPKGPVFVWARRGNLLGQAVSFDQMSKLHVHPFFTQGVPHATLDRAVVAQEKQLMHNFMIEEASSVKKWEEVGLYKILIPIASPHKTRNKSGRQGPNPPRKQSRRLLQLGGERGC